MKTICFKLNPNQNQVNTLNKWLNDLRWVWNAGLHIIEESEQYKLRVQNDLLDDDFPVPWRWHPNQTGKDKTVFGLCCDITAHYSRRYSKKDQLFPSPFADYRLACPVKVLRGNEQPQGYCFEFKNPFKSLAKFFKHENHPDKPWFAAIPAVCIRGVLQSLSDAWMGYKKGIKKRPRYKRKEEVLTTLINNDAKKIKVKGNKINLPKLGVFTVKTINKRWSPSTPICTLKIIKKPSGWYLQLTGDIPEKPYKPSNVACGLDVGLQYIISDDAGKTVEPPKYYRKAEKRLRRLQRKASRRQEFLKANPGKSQGKNLQKIRKQIARQHEKIADQRSRFNHKISTYRVRTYGAIATENIQIKNLVRRPKPVETQEGSGIYVKNNASAKSGLNKSLLDAGLAQLLTMMEVKAKTHDREFVRVNPAYTSQDCPACGNRVKKALSTRTHNCLECGTILPRDVAAAINIKKAANFSQKYRSSVREFTPGEISKEIEEPGMVLESVVKPILKSTSSSVEDASSLPIQLSLSFDIPQSGDSTDSVSLKKIKKSRVSGQPRKRGVKPGLDEGFGVQGALPL